MIVSPASMTFGLEWSRRIFREEKGAFEGVLRMMGQTALDLAVANNRDEIIDLLIGAGGICKQVRLWKGKRDGS